MVKNKRMNSSSKSKKGSNKSSLKNKSLLLYNDDFNSFDHVIDCLVTICDHNPVQAEQCALITHINGCCEIASGTLSDLDPLQEDLVLYGLNVGII